MDNVIVMNEAPCLLIIKVGDQVLTRKGFGQIIQKASGVVNDFVYGQFSEDVKDFIQRNREALMQVKEITVIAANNFAPKQFQSITVSAGMTIALDEGDDPGKIIEETFDTCASFVCSKRENFAKDLGY